MQGEPFEPRKEADLKVIRLDMHAFEEICSIPHVGEPTFVTGLPKIAARREETTPKCRMNHLDIALKFGSLEQSVERRFHNFGVLAKTILPPPILQSLHWK
jgi:hypothetical protein